jgi:hypothetical protein
MSKDKIMGKLPELLSGAGFSEINIEKNFSSIFGTISHLKGVKP